MCVWWKMVARNYHNLIQSKETNNKYHDDQMRWYEMKWDQGNNNFYE